MAKSTSIHTLMAAHEKEVVASVTQHINNIGWDRVNPNDVWWEFEEPRFQKKFGRAARIYNRMRKLNDLD